MFVKIHKKGEQTIVAVCDEELIGKKFEEGSRQLEVKEDFYKGEVRSSTEVGDLMRNADVVNIVGPLSVNLGIEECIIEESHIVRVQGVPHAQVILKEFNERI